MAATRTRDQGKTSFVKEFLNDNPQANPKAVNEAWEAAGMEGTISDTLVNKQRAALGLSGNIRGKAKGRRSAGRRAAATTSTGRVTRTAGRAETATRTTTLGARRGRPSARSTRLVELEADLDRLLYRVMDTGELTDVEDALRLARRRLYGAFNGSR